MKLIIEPTPADAIVYKVPNKEITLDPSKIWVLNIGKDGKWHVYTMTDISFDSYEKVTI
ncbi:MAG: hypothetical protein WC516_08055 [Patescibacteria group bacterium]|jgi:hypothetical protein